MQLASPKLTLQLASSSVTARLVWHLVQVTEGNGRMIVVAVGEHSEWGKTLSMVIGDGDETPLQEKLTVLAGAIGKLGTLVAVLTFTVLLIR